MTRNSSTSISQFILVNGLLGSLLVIGFIGLVVGRASYEDIRVVRQLQYCDELGFNTLDLRLTPATYHLLREGLVAGGISGLLLFAFWWRINWITSAAAEFTAELRHGRASFRRWWNRLPVSSRYRALGLLGLLIALRTWYVIYYPLDLDEVNSYYQFVNNGPLTITTYYPIPNNHILYNLLEWPLAELGLTSRLVMRLPTLLLGTCGTAVSLVLLARLIGLRRAMFLIALVAFNRLWVYYGAAGRGYFLQVCLLQCGFFASVELLRPDSPYRRLSWLVFIVSSVLGLYLIPTYAYPLVALGAGLGAGFIIQRRSPELLMLSLASSIIGLVALMLYVPIGVVSGWDRLLSNHYVVSQPIDQFWHAYRFVLYERAAELFGPLLLLGKPLLAAWLTLAALGGIATWRWVPAGPTRILAYLAWIQLAVPLLLMAEQRVYAPTRTLLYLTFFGYLLILLLLEGLPWRRWLPTKYRWDISFAVIISICFLFLYHSKFYMQGAEQETQLMKRVYTWLCSQQTTNRPVRVWMDSPRIPLYYSYYAVVMPWNHLEMYTGDKQLALGKYDFLLIDNQIVSRNWKPDAHYRQVYHEGQVTIYTHL